MHEMLLKACHS